MEYNNIYNPLQPASVFPMSMNWNSNIVQPPHVEIIKVNGKNGAEAYQLGPNSSILLLDQNDPLIWFVSTDGAGYKTVLPYKITPFKQQQPEDLISQLTDRIAKLEERMNIQHESNTSVSQPAKSTEWSL